MLAMPMTPPSDRALALRLFAVSFISLFLELMVIRWAPSVVRLVAYYANLMLISSFLGLGIGAMLAARRWSLFGWFPALLAGEIGLLIACRHVAAPGSDVEHRFYGVSPQWLSTLMLLGIFAMNSLVFVPLGQQIGALFQALPTLRAYAWDLGGSLCGTIGFGAFSFHFFSPVLGIALVAMVFLVLASGCARLWGVPVFAVVLIAAAIANDGDAIWSPYYYITVRQENARLNATGRETDPLIYRVSVNQDFYQFHGTIDATRYQDHSIRPLVAALRDQYLLPYSLCQGRRRVAVLGSGGGMDVEAALLSGAQQVDAVEIDHTLVELARRLNPSSAYNDRRVTVHVDDARSFLRKTTDSYDLVVFGFLDSQALFTALSNLRLDGFTYTVEAVRAAFHRLDPDGLLAISFAAGQEWLAHKLVRMTVEATGKQPLVYVSGSQIILAASRGSLASPPPRFGRFRHAVTATLADIAVPTDDWPYLYLSRRTVPGDYLLVIGLLMTASLAAVLKLRGRAWSSEDGHFLFLGMGFLLLQTKSISDCSLYFGATWFVTMIVVAGVLIMVLFANWAATHITESPLALYAPLFLALVALYWLPRDWVLSWSFPARLAWTLAAVPLPVFFAGLIFSTTLRASENPATLFGANLVGAMIGGFSEYLAMAIGSRNLTLLVFAAYLCSLLCRVLPRGNGGRT
jgi:hypothetical protein